MVGAVVVTRHPALVDYLAELGIVAEEVITHATAEDVAGKHVIGVLPLHLAALTVTVTTVPLNIPPELRGEELTLEQVREFAGTPATYYVGDITADAARPRSMRALAWEAGGYLGAAEDAALALSVETKS